MFDILLETLFHSSSIEMYGWDRPTETDYGIIEFFDNFTNKRIQLLFDKDEIKMKEVT